MISIITRRLRGPGPGSGDHQPREVGGDGVLRPPRLRRQLDGGQLGGEVVVQRIQTRARTLLTSVFSAALPGVVEPHGSSEAKDKIGKNHEWSDT